MRHPFYFGIAALTCVYLLFANLRGWSLFNAAGVNRWGPQGRSVYHK